jgi:tetratricopeptide (TPR) repeat protein
MHVLCVALSAGAQDERARLHLQAGASYYEAGDYEDALREFQRAHVLSQRPELFYNFALCYQQLGDLQNAATYLRRYLDEVQSIENRDQLERRHANLLERIAAQEADPSARPVFRFEFDDAERSGAEDDEAPATPPGQVETPLQSSPRPRARRPERDPAAASATDSVSREGAPVGAMVGYSVAGVGVLLATTLGALALRERGQVEDGCGSDRSCSGGDVQRMDGFALGADIGLALIVAGATVGTILLLTGRGGDDDEESAEQASIRLAPYMSPMGAGATLRGTF